MRSLNYIRNKVTSTTDTQNVSKDIELNDSQTRNKEFILTQLMLNYLCIQCFSSSIKKTNNINY